MCVSDAAWACGGAFFIGASSFSGGRGYSAMPVRIAERSIALHQRLAWTTAAIAAAASRELSQQGETIVVYCPAMMWRSYVPGPTHKARNSWAVPTESKRLFDDHRPDHA